MNKTRVAPPPAEEIREQVRLALAEDHAGEDLSGALVAETHRARAVLSCREEMVLCGTPWVEETFAQLDQKVQLQWRHSECELLPANSEILHLEGPARALLAGERTALNFLQLLSGIATFCNRLVTELAGLPVLLMDTRKTLPGLRSAQKYAVRAGGGVNHRAHLAAAYLLKENHIAALGSIAAAVRQARRQHPEKTLEVEVENCVQLEEAIDAGADIALLDNFGLQELRQAVRIAGDRIVLEASGNIDERNVREVAATGVARISSGALTKNCRAADLSLRFF